MQVITTGKEMQAFSKKIRVEGKTIGFVPTMGALHAGHLSLVRRSVKDNDITLVSIFINPTQFGPKEDFNRYPKDHKGDMEKLSSLNVDAVFLPDVAETYNQPYFTGKLLKFKSNPISFSLGFTSFLEGLQEVQHTRDHKFRDGDSRGIASCQSNSFLRQHAEHRIVKASGP